MVIFVLLVSGTSIYDLVGWTSSAKFSISTLDSSYQVNFPVESNHYASATNATNTFTELTIANSDSGVVWKVVGFSNYTDVLVGNEDLLGMFGKLPSGKHLNKSGYGFWVQNFGPTFYNRNASVASISALRIRERLDIDRENMEVAVAIRAYVDGEATIALKYEDVFENLVHTEKMSQRIFKNKGFCYKILEIPFEKSVDTVNIN